MVNDDIFPGLAEFQAEAHVEGKPTWVGVAILYSNMGW